MKNELDSKFLLQVFDKIRQHGAKEDEQYKLNGITAFTDHDGYTLYISEVAYSQLGTPAAGNYVDWRCLPLNMTKH